MVLHTYVANFYKHIVGVQFWILKSTPEQCWCSIQNSEINSRAGGGDFRNRNEHPQFTGVDFRILK